MKALVLLLPRLAGMLAALMADRAVPGRAKLLLAALAVYLVTPLDLIPDFIPFFGWLDDAVLVALVLDRLVSLLGRPCCSSTGHSRPRTSTPPSPRPGGSRPGCPSA